MRKTLGKYNAKTCTRVFRKMAYTSKKQLSKSSEEYKLKCDRETVTALLPE